MNLDRLAEAITPHLLPHLRPYLVQVARTAVDRSLKRSLRVRVEPGYVLTHDPTTGRAAVALDTDQAATNVRSVGVYPLVPGDRVVVLFAPPHGGYIIGHGQGTPVAPIVSTEGSGGTVTSSSLSTKATVEGPLVHRQVQVVFQGAVDVDQSATAGVVALKPEVSLDGGVTWQGSASFEMAMGASESRSVPFMEVAAGQPSGAVLGRLRASRTAGTATLASVRSLLFVLPRYDYGPAD